MLQPTNFYYPTTNLNYGVQEQIYGLRKELDAFLAKMFFAHDEDRLSRVIWAPSDYTFYRRREQLGEEASSSDTDDLQLPFLSYFRDDGWVMDDRPGAQQMSSIMHQIRWGEDNTGLQGQALHAQRFFNGLVFFSSERDASIALDTIMWWHNRRWNGTYAFYASDTKVLLPATATLDNAAFLPESNMTTFMREREMYAVSFTFLLRTPLVKLPPEQPATFFTEEVIHYFHNRNFTVPEEELPDTEEGWQNIASEVMELTLADENAPPVNDDGTSNSLVDIEFTLDKPDSKGKSVAEFTWGYTGSQPPSQIKFFLHRGRTIDTFEVDLSESDYPDNMPTSMRIPDLEPGSVYDVAMIAYYAPARADKYHFQIDTPDLPDRSKGLTGLKGMTI